LGSVGGRKKKKEVPGKRTGPGINILHVVENKP
jgi:hypothetical protein